jgi:hypothetical protein
MKLVRTRLLVVVVAAVGFLASGCYTIQADLAEQNHTAVPWFCDPIAENSVTGPGMGSVNFYAGVTRAPLSYAQCKQVGTMIDQGKAYATKYPTLGAGKAAGMHNGFDFIAGMGTHTGYGFDPAMLNDPDFDPQHPVFPGTNVDDVFDPAEPEFLQYNGNTNGSVLVGWDYYVRTDTGQPPAGFPGDNDWWHVHPTLCANKTTGTAFAVNTTDTQCANQNGVNLHLQNYYMLHVWAADNLEYHADVHAAMHPCIKGTGAIFDMTNPCHQDFVHAAGTSGASLTSAAKRTDAAKMERHHCPIGRLDASA